MSLSGGSAVGAIIGRRQEPGPTRWGWVAALNRPVPSWMGRFALGYALIVTLLSVCLQATALGRQLADVSRAANISSTHLLVLVLPARRAGADVRRRDRDLRDAGLGHLGQPSADDNSGGDVVDAVTGAAGVSC